MKQTIFVLLLKTTDNFMFHLKRSCCSLMENEIWYIQLFKSATLFGPSSKVKIINKHFHITLAMTVSVYIIYVSPEL